ncbi:LuxR C-terminal-related transcriptional regulator [Kitasatospora sp. NBC_00315]|uniref:LuxR C-terminal-related transcriptional regulator n=1 Tax=Kitasatospora sp. NBC_00315 TaxID=2975963 RepID=UPI0032541DA2
MTGDLDGEEIAHNRNEAIRVALVDDHRLFRDGLRSILSAEDDFRVVAEGVPDEAVDLAAHCRPDIILMDVHRTSISPVATIRRILSDTPETRVVVLSGMADNALILSLANAGAAAYLTKNIGGRELCSELRQVASDSRMFALRMPRTAVTPPGYGSGMFQAVLTDRELEILRLVSVAMTNSQIATKLFVSEATVKRHLTNIFAKLAARSRLEAVNRGTALGLLQHHG